MTFWTLPLIMNIIRGKYMKKTIFCLMIFILLAIGCKKESVENIKEMKDKSNTSSHDLDFSKYKVTFIELGSINCVPCKMMQPGMKKVEENHKDVNVVFYDVWTKEQAHFAQLYQIRVIPTQVFIDSKGEEFYRHEGFLPYEEVIKILNIDGFK